MELLAKTKTFYKHLVCSKNGDFYDKSQLQTFSAQNKPLLACYDWNDPIDKQALNGRVQSMWRYREMLPIESDDAIVTLGEGMTPLNALSILETKYGFSQLYLKDEAMNPTGSFKARGLAMAISKAKELGVTKCVIPTAGNAGGALSAYCAKAGIEAHIFMPKATPKCFVQECIFYGAKITLVDGNIKDCAKQIKKQNRSDWFDISTLKEPFRLEGKKTMGYEIAEQLNWEVPDVVVYPTGGGTGLIGIWKAFEEMEQLGWTGNKRPKMVAVQTAGCYPIVEAFHSGEQEAKPFENPGLTVANGLRVPAAFGDELILSILRASNGNAIKITEAEMKHGIHEVAQKEGVLLSPEGAAVWEAAKKLRATNWIKASDQVVLLNTGSMYKYMENFYE